MVSRMLLLPSGRRMYASHALSKKSSMARLTISWNVTGSPPTTANARRSSRRRLFSSVILYVMRSMGRPLVV